MPQIYKRLLKELSEGRPAVYAMIIRQSGSAPRSCGTRFLICRDGDMVGSIGGGIFESSVIKAAGGLMGHDEAMIVDFDMTGDMPVQTDMICGGSVEVLVRGITPDNSETRTVLSAVESTISKNENGILVTGPLPEKGYTAKVENFFYSSQSQTCGSISDNGYVREFISQRAGALLKSNALQLMYLGSKNLAIVAEPLFTIPSVIIFGAGHISACLAPLLSMVDFRVIVVDDRNEFANRIRFPKVNEIVVSDFRECFDLLDFSNDTYSVIVTRGHIHDQAVLKQVLKRPGCYVGMIGSSRKRDVIYEALIKEGISDELLRKVHAPIGLNIGAQSPEAIAISIAAEIIQVHSNGSCDFGGRQV